MPAPVLRDVNVNYETRLFNGSFMKENIYRRPGSTEVDQAWEDLGVDCKRLDSDARVTSLTLDIVRSSRNYFIRRRFSQWTEAFICSESGQVWRRVPRQRRRNASFTLPSEPHLPPSKYPQLTHLVQNLLRKSLYFNYDHYKQLGKHEFINEEIILRPHISK